ncbi:hypothetical protein SAMN05660337_3121 [Maridesulfovibrio ferrireducens]|uniref:Uncharacterized protein n=1 Tax=Maridesulfovibrio ferrireducens TaxID=246191 RepID=A0A1G9KKC3_9BACT|nr:hypothetical protein [Maridesulfovibrio ferrireducens]SDL50171.1 hypothetical protein SAMN05660337_3121 [Maridesulfovibrio ferrireducens]
MDLTPRSFDRWFDAHLSDDDPDDVLELYRSVKAGESLGDNWNLKWQGSILLIEGNDPEWLPLHSQSAIDCFLHMMEQRWGENEGEAGIEYWAENGNNEK